MEFSSSNLKISFCQFLVFIVSVEKLQISFLVHYCKVICLPLKSFFFSFVLCRLNKIVMIPLGSAEFLESISAFYQFLKDTLAILLQIFILAHFISSFFVNLIIHIRSFENVWKVSCIPLCSLFFLFSLLITLYICC